MESKNGVLVRLESRPTNFPPPIFHPPPLSPSPPLPMRSVRSSSRLIFLRYFPNFSIYFFNFNSYSVQYSRGQWHSIRKNEQRACRLFEKYHRLGWVRRYRRLIAYADKRRAQHEDNIKRVYRRCRSFRTYLRGRWAIRRAQNIHYYRRIAPGHSR